MKEEVELRKLGSQGGHSEGNRTPHTVRSLHTNIPKKFAEVLQLEPGDYIKMTLKNKSIIVEKYIFKS
jgi:hypothetical protein